MADRTPWPAWARYTATAAIAFGGAMWIASDTFGGIRRDAADAKAGVENHEPRIQAVEKVVDRLDRDVPELKADVKEILRRLPK